MDINRLQEIFKELAIAQADNQGHPSTPYSVLIELMLDSESQDFALNTASTAINIAKEKTNV